MTAVIEVEHLTKRYGDTLAVDDVSFAIEKGAIYGLLGRNGAGKTTLMSILTAQNFATSGEVRIFGENPYENARVLGRMCFVRESQKYPDDAKPGHAFRMARLFFPNWDEAFAQRLAREFGSARAFRRGCGRRASLWHAGPHRCQRAACSAGNP